MPGLSSTLLAFLALACSDEKASRFQPELSGAEVPELGAETLRRLADCLPNDPPHTLPVCLRAQEGPSWCWAAAAQMMLENAEPGSRFPQRDMMQAATGASCPAAPCSATVGSCDTPGWPPFDEPYEAMKTPGPLRWEDLKAEMSAGRPVAFAWCWRRDGAPCTENGTGHIMVAAGVLERTVQGRPIRGVLTLDPAPCCTGDIGYFTYGQYRRGNTYNHWRDYYCVHHDSSDVACPDYGASPDEALESVAASSLVSPAAVAEMAVNGLLSELQSLVTLNLYSDSALRAELGQPFDLHDRLELEPELRRFQLSPESLLDPDLDSESAFRYLEDVGWALYPVGRAGQTLAMVQVVRNEPGGPDAETIGSWRLAAFGHPVLAGRLAEARRTLREALPQAAGADLVEVWVPGLNAHFIAPRSFPWLQVSRDVGSCNLDATPPIAVRGNELLAELRERARALLATGGGLS